VILGVLGGSPVLALLCELIDLRRQHEVRFDKPVHGMRPRRKLDLGESGRLKTSRDHGNLLGRALAIRAISQNAFGAAQRSRYHALRNNSPKNEDKNEQNSRNSRRAVTSGVGGCTNNACTDEEPGQHALRDILPGQALGPGYLRP
jgi:hypothetical protein